MALVLCAVAVAGGAGGAAGPGQDWPQWRGPRRDGVSTESNWVSKWPDSGPKVLWKAQVGTGFSGVAVVGERVYTMGFIRNQGAKSATMEKQPGLDHVWCLDGRTGKPIWKHTYPSKKWYYHGPFGTPMVDEGKVYTLGKFGDLFCLDAATGKVVWSTNITRSLKAKMPYYGYSCMPVIVGDLLILNAGHPGPAMAALNKKTGKVVWKAEQGPAGYSSPVAYEVGGKKAVTILTPPAVLGLDAATGRLLWKHPWNTGPQSSATTPLVSGTKVFISASEAKQWCVLLDVGGAKPKVVWEHNQMNNYFNASVLYEGHLYGSHSTDHISRNFRLRCIDFKTGKVKWDKAGLGKGGFTLAGGRLIVLCEKGELVIAEADPKRYKELARAKVLDGTCWSPPVLCRGRIYCRDHLGTIVCLDVSGR